MYMEESTIRQILPYDLGKEPSNVDFIDTNLWLGNLGAASDVGLLQENKVKSILTVNSFPLAKETTGLLDINIMYIEVADTPKDDLLSHFDETYEFIQQAVKKGVVLVHCYHGVSRSPTIVIAYLMKKKNLTVEAAHKYVKSKRKCVEPNHGFLTQLKLYEKMHCAVDNSNVQFKMFRLDVAAGLFEKDISFPASCIDVIKADPLVATTVTSPTIFRCKKCRRVLAQDCNIISHVPGGEYDWSECLENAKSCQLIYFIEPLAWMEGVCSSLEGKLLCPGIKCKNKLGSFSWINGCHCPCGTHVCPGFYLIPSKVDKHSVVNMSETNFQNTCQKC